MQNDKWIDITIPIRNEMVHWPGDMPVRLEQTQFLERGDPYNLSTLAIGVHTGTHIDAPSHYLVGEKAIDAMPPDATIGPARVIEIDDPVSIKVRDLHGRGIRRGELLLFKTRNSERQQGNDRFIKDYVYIGPEAARWLAGRKVRTIGIDYLSVGGYETDQAEPHEILLGAGIWLIEGLDLSAVAEGRYDLVCLPLRLVGAEGAPARAVVRRRKG